MPKSAVRTSLPGLAVCLLISASAWGIVYYFALSGLSPIILAAAIAIGIRAIAGRCDPLQPGAVLAAKRILRLGIILLGVQITLPQILDVGATGLLIAIVALVSTLAFTIKLGPRLGVSLALSCLIAAGTSICGAAAVVVANSVVRASDDDLAYSLGTVTIFGTAAMLCYPLLAAMLALDPQAYGQWIGSSVHEVAQVTAAGFQFGEAAGNTATIVKLARVLLLAPAVLALAFWLARADARNSLDAASIPIPWFIGGFLMVVALNSAHLIPGQVVAVASAASPVLLGAALAGIGLMTSAGEIKGRGWRPLLLAGLASVYIAGISLVSILLMDGFWPPN